MNTYPLSPIPSHGGVYAIKNNKTGHVYIGRSIDLSRRFNEWKHAMTYRRALKNGPIADMLEQDPNLAHWTFTILHHDASATMLDLMNREAVAIERLKGLGDKLLNSQGANDPVAGTGLPIKVSRGVVTLTDADGNEISQREGAAILGCRVDTLRQRLTNMHKKKGITEISLVELL